MNSPEINSAELSDYELLEIMRGTLMAHGAIEPDACDVSEAMNQPEKVATVAVLRNVIAAARAKSEAVMSKPVPLTDDEIDAVANSMPMQAAMTKEPKLCWSIDEENFSFSDIEDAINVAHTQGIESVWQAIAVMKEPSAYVCAASVIENIIEAGFDDGGEYAEDFGDCTDEAKAELEGLLSEWANKHLTVNFWSASNIVEIDVAAHIASRGAK